MRIEDNREQSAEVHMEALSTGGTRPDAPDAALLKDYGPLSDTPSQARLDLSAEVVTEGQSLSPIQASLRRLGRDRRAMICLGLLLTIIVLSYIGPFIYLNIGPTIMGGPAGTTRVPPSVYHLYTHQELTNTDGPSTAANPLGTDQIGRDILARLMAGVNVSIEVALMVEIFDVGLGLIIGALAGYFGGWIDTFLARFTDVMFTFPGLLFAFLAAATIGPSFTQRFGFSGRLILVSLALGIAVWPQMARFVRGQTLQLKEQQFIEAARTVGATNRTIITRHIIPNLFSIVVVASTLNVVGTIIAEAVISLLGLGVVPPGSSLGLMINDGIGQRAVNPMEVVWPSLMLVTLVVCLSFIGDGVRDAFDPRTKD